MGWPVPPPAGTARKDAVGPIGSVCAAASIERVGEVQFAGHLPWPNDENPLLWAVEAKRVGGVGKLRLELALCRECGCVYALEAGR